MRVTIVLILMTLFAGRMSHSFFHNLGKKIGKIFKHPLKKLIAKHPFEESFLKHDQKLDKLLKSSKDKLKGLLTNLSKRRHQCPNLPFRHRPIYPFPHTFHPIPRNAFGVPMYHAPYHIGSVPPGKTHIHLFAEYRQIKQQKLLLANGQTAVRTQYLEVWLSVDFNVDNNLLARMKSQFAKYHRLLMHMMGGTFAYYHGMLPHIQHHCPRYMKRIQTFPRLFNKLIWIHEMEARHAAFLKMIENQEHNKKAIKDLEDKLEKMIKNSKELKKHFDALDEKYVKGLDKKIGKNLMKKN